MNATDPNAAAAPRPLPDAFIYLAGLGGELIDQSGAGITKRLAREFDRSARSDTAKFFVDPKNREETFGGDQEKPLKIKACSINRKDSDGERKVVDLYELDYRAILTKKYQDDNIPKKTIRLLWVLLPNILRFLKALSFSRKEKKTAEKLQFIFAAGILALSLVYFISLGLAAYQILPPYLKSADPLVAHAAPKDAPPPAPASAGPTLPVAIVILFAIIELFYPGFKQGWNIIAVDYLAAMEYLDPGTRKAVIGGQLTDLLAYLAEKQEYRQIHLLSYSFGTLVALDTLFPSGGQPGARFPKLHTFITIGCPFDIIRLFWPYYYNNRYALPETPQQWLNIYSRRDILASNFRNDYQEKEAEIELKFNPELNLLPRLPKNIPYRISSEPETITFLNSLNPLNLKAHSSYWEHAFESELTCFSAIIKKMYGDDAILN